MRSRVWFPALILVVLLVLVVNGSLELSTGSMVFPWVVGAFGSILLVGQIVREVRGTQQGAFGEEPGRASFNLRTYLLGIAWLLAILPMVYLLGFFVTIPLYIFLCLKLLGEKWLLCLILTSLVGVFFYFGFVVALKVPFYEGLLFSYIMG